MNMMIDVFGSYARRDGDRLRLSKRQLRSVLSTEIAELLQVNRIHPCSFLHCFYSVFFSLKFFQFCFQKANKDPDKVERIMLGLDENLDGQVDFEEFMNMVTKLTVCSNSYFNTVYGQSWCGVK